MSAEAQDIPSGYSLEKEYDFRTMQSLEEFDTRLIWPRDKIINNEQQYYLDPEQSPEHSPVFLSSNGLSIVATQTHESLKGTTEQPYISGVLTTRSKGHSRLFGHWEISAKLPNARGAWPAFWLLPTFKQWPEGIAVLSEIDIMEAVVDVLGGVYHCTAHTNESGALVTTTDNAVQTNADLTGEFNRYGLSWSREWIIWYFNGKEVKRFKTPSDMQTEPRHALLNLAVGGSWAGEPVAEDYPASFDIEYLRIYKPEEDLTQAEELEALNWLLFKACHGRLGHGMNNNQRGWVVSMLESQIDEISGPH